MSDLSNTELAEKVLNSRAVAHRAVTEGVNLKYVEVLRRACYEACDLADALLARLDDAKKGWTAAENARTRAEARLDAVTRELAKWQRVADGIERSCQIAEADRDRYKAAYDFEQAFYHWLDKPHQAGRLDDLLETVPDQWQPSVRAALRAAAAAKPCDAKCWLYGCLRPCGCYRGTF